MITKQKYVEYLLSTPNNYTCTNLAEHLEGVSHDVVSDFLSRERLTPRQLWELVQGRINDSGEAFLLADDSVQDQRYSQFIELVKRQYSGNEHGLVQGIGVVNLVHSSGAAGDFWPIDYRIYAPEADGKTQHEHFREMFLRAVTDQQIQARTILFDAWYASVDNGRIHKLGEVRTNRDSKRALAQARRKCNSWLSPDSLQRMPTPLKRCWISHLQALSPPPLPIGNASCRYRA
jgi:hypothetical protein